MKQKGFTLIEVLVYVGVVGIVASSVISFSLWMLRTQGNLERQEAGLAEGERVMSAISREIWGSFEVYEPTSTLKEHPGQLSLKTARSVPAEDPFVYTDIYLCGDKICVKREGEDSVVASSEDVVIEQLIFTRSGARSFRVTLVIDGVQLQSTFSMRAF
ncbi:MAG: type II secretion system protein [bacterium]|nr:type II secretion system protein [bacterium]